MKRSTPGVVWLLCAAWLAAPVAALAQEDVPYECDDRYDPCGTPEQSGGGGGGGGGGGSVLVNNTDLGVTYQYADDYDDDGIEDPHDNCPWSTNPDQLDDDGDGIGTACDNCPTRINLDQHNLDGDAFGDECDWDEDGDGIDDKDDVCSRAPDPRQSDVDGDGLGDACDVDIDGDGVENLVDNCPMQANPDQANDSLDAFGDACDEDDDGDGIRNVFDNCGQVSNFDQGDADLDGLGDACDADLDGDGVANTADNCPDLENLDQADFDRDGLGEACDDRYCFVVFGNEGACLDPMDPFHVYSPDLAVNTGDEVRLRLFGNHVSQALSYTFQVVDAPRGSRARVANSLGSAHLSSPYEYRYENGFEVLFTPDKPGTYAFQVVAELEGSDLVTGEVGSRSQWAFTLDAEGDPVKGCATVPGSGGWLWLGLTGLLVRRRSAA